MAFQDFENGPDRGETFDDWIRREIVPEIEAMEADPSSGFTLGQVRAALDEDRRKTH